MGEPSGGVLTSLAALVGPSRAAAQANAEDSGNPEVRASDQ